MTPPAASAAAAPAIHPRRTATPRRAPVVPRKPRRISGPANPARNPSRNPARSQTRGRVGPVHAVGLAEAVATHRLLDRLIRGRLWIGVIAFALIGIVTMQLGLLKLNAGIGRSLEREALLQRENATLSAENSEIAAGESVESQAERMGMELIPSGALRFLAARPFLDPSKASALLSATVSTATGSATTTSPITTLGTAATEGSSGTETGAATPSTASAETSETSATPTSTPVAGGTSETGSEAGSATTRASTSPSATTQEVSGASVTGSTSETRPTETASSPGSGPSGGAGVPASSTSSASTGGGTTPEG